MTIFEKIISREIPAHIIWENDNYLAFLDIKPIQAGHTLVIPKKPINDLLAMTDEDYTHLWLTAKKLAIPLKKAMSAKKIGFIVEGFGVDHVHIHLVPINNAGELNPDKAQTANQAELTATAEKIKSTILDIKE